MMLTSFQIKPCPVLQAPAEEVEVRVNFEPPEGCESSLNCSSFPPEQTAANQHKHCENDIMHLEHSELRFTSRFGQMCQKQEEKRYEYNMSIDSIISLQYRYYIQPYQPWYLYAYVQLRFQFKKKSETGRCRKNFSDQVAELLLSSTCFRCNVSG